MAGDAIVVRPTNNGYTVLVIVAFLVMYMRANTLFPQSGLL